MALYKCAIIIIIIIIINLRFYRAMHVALARYYLVPYCLIRDEVILY